MKQFMQAHDTPNWMNLAFLVTCYMLVVCQEKLEMMRREKYERLTEEEHP